MKNNKNLETVNTTEQLVANENIPADIPATPETEPVKPFYVNGQIVSANLGLDDKGNLLISMNLKGSTWNLEGWGKILTEKNSYNSLKRLFSALEIPSLAQLNGCPIRAIVYNNNVIAIAHFMKEVEPFMLIDNEPTEQNEGEMTNAN